MLTPKVSVALATYNGEKFLSSQLASLAKQTRLPDELVVCDDLSSDSTLSILHAFAVTAPFKVRVYENPINLGYIENFFHALSLCDGDLIAFCDQDDIWQEDKLQVQLQELIQSGAMLHAHSCRLIDTHNADIGEFRQCEANGNVTLDDFSLWNTFFGFTCIFSRQLKDIFPPERRPIDLIEGDRKMAHDRWFCLLAILVGEIHYTNKYLASYRQHGRNLFGAERGGMMQKLVKVRSKYVEYLTKRSAIAHSFVEISRQLIESGFSVKNVVASQWRLDADWYRSRLAMFQAKPLHRVIKLAKLIYNGAYSGQYRAAMEDVVAILLGAERG